MKSFFDSKLQKSYALLFEETIVRGILKHECKKEYTKRQ